MLSNPCSISPSLCILVLPSEFCHFWLQLLVTMIPPLTKLLSLAVPDTSHTWWSFRERLLLPVGSFDLAFERYPDAVIFELPSGWARDAMSRPRMKVAKDGRQPTMIAKIVSICHVGDFCRKHSFSTGARTHSSLDPSPLWKKGQFVHVQMVEINKSTWTYQYEPRCADLSRRHA